MYHPIVKEQVIPGQLEGLQAVGKYSVPACACQPPFHSHHSHSVHSVYFACDSTRSKHPLDNYDRRMNVFVSFERKSAMLKIHAQTLKIEKRWPLAP
jgi:hypothetical protein